MTNPEKADKFMAKVRPYLREQVESNELKISEEQSKRIDAFFVFTENKKGEFRYFVDEIIDNKFTPEIRTYLDSIWEEAAFQNS